MPKNKIRCLKQFWKSDIVPHSLNRRQNIWSKEDKIVHSSSDFSLVILITQKVNNLHMTYLEDLRRQKIYQDQAELPGREYQIDWGTFPKSRSLDAWARQTAGTCYEVSWSDHWWQCQTGTQDTPVSTAHTNTSEACVLSAATQQISIVNSHHRSHAVDINKRCTNTSYNLCFEVWLTDYWHWLQNTQRNGRATVRQSVCPHRSTAAAACRRLVAKYPAGRRYWSTNASSVIFTAKEWGWTQTCLLTH